MCIGMRSPVFLPADFATSSTAVAVSSTQRATVIRDSIKNEDGLGGLGARIALVVKREVGQLAFLQCEQPSRKRSLSGTMQCPTENIVPRRHSNLVIINSNPNDNNKIAKKQRRKSSNSGGRSRRNVHFSKSFSLCSSMHTLTENDKVELWYDLDDCAQMNVESKRAVGDFRASNVDVVRHVLCVSSQCSYSKPNTAYLQTVRLMLPDDCRGLELGLLPNRIRQRRQEHVRKVLEAQKMMVDWQKMGEATASEEERTVQKTPAPLRPSFGKLDVVLAARARKSSQSSRLFAQLLGREVATGVATEVDQKE